MTMTIIGWVGSKLKTLFLSKKNFDKRVVVSIISQKIKAMNISLLIEKYYSLPTAITFTFDIFIFLYVTRAL